MNTLAYRCTDDNGLSFELLVDGSPLGALVGARDSAIPYWIFSNDLPTVPPEHPEPRSDTRIVTVCSCGEYGCGHTRCRVIRDSDTVVFREFDMDVSAEGRRQEFRFSSENYGTVVAEICKRAQEYRGQHS